MYGYTIPPSYEFYESYLTHGPRQTSGNYPTEHIMTFNYSPDMLSCYHGSPIQDPEPWIAVVVWWFKDDDICMDTLSYCFMSVKQYMDHI